MAKTTPASRATAQMKTRQVDDKPARPLHRAPLPDGFAAAAARQEQASQADANAAQAKEIDESVQPDPVAHRKTLPAVPTGLVGRSAQLMIVRINATARQSHPKHPDLGTLIADVSRQPVKNLHPAVASYKAECLDYLRGLQEAQLQPRA